jgi:hypothetical protein
MLGSVNKAAASALIVLAFTIGTTSSPISVANSMNVIVTSGDGTSIHRDSVQDSAGGSIPDTVDDDEQDTYVERSEETTPRVKAAGR